MITPRSTRLVRVKDLGTFRDAVAALACEGQPLDARDRFVIVPTRSAASHLVRAIEDRHVVAGRAVILPELLTRAELFERLASRLPEPPRILDAFEREALLGVACRAAGAEGCPPPFRLRPALVAEILRLYDELRRHENDVAKFERLALDILEPGAEVDRGAERLVRQTRFLAAAFRQLEARCAAAGGVDEHGLRAVLLATASPRPFRHAIVTVRDRAADPYGLWNTDFDLLTRLPGLERVDLVVTETCLAGAFHERVRRLLPGVQEEVWDGGRLRGEPVLQVPRDGGPAHLARDREEEVAGFARRVRQGARGPGGSPLDRMALVVLRRLPYVYVAREVLRSAGVPCQMFDALPLAAEPYAAALDLVFSCVSSNFARGPMIALLRTPHFRFERNGRPLAPRHVSALDRALSAGGYLGDPAALERLVEGWRREPGHAEGPAEAGAVALDVARALAPLRDAAPVAGHLGTLIRFLGLHETVPGPDDPLRDRQLRARAAVTGALGRLRDAHAAYDDAPGEFERVAATVRRWIESQTFAPRAGDTGVHVVDAESARYGDFAFVQLAGLVESEWPDRQQRSIFYSPGVLRALGWPAEKERLDGARAAFVDLLGLPSRRLAISTFALEDDAVVSASPFLDEVESAGLERIEEEVERVRCFEWEALGQEPVHLEGLAATAREWAEHRLRSGVAGPVRRPGATAGHAADAFAVSALERYQDCPFKFFAADVLRLEETPEDEPTLSPRARGRFIHEVFQRFFEEWGRRGRATITPDDVDEARALFEAVAGGLLARLPEAEAALERTRLFGSAIAVGIVDVVLGIEASRPVPVAERWLEHRLDGEFTLGSGTRRVRLRGVADRIDLLEGRRLRVIDYKSGYPPNVKRALQVPVYALGAVERLTARDGEPWRVDEAAYVAFTGRRAHVPVVRAGASDPDEVLSAARARLFDALDAIARGEFPPRPHDPMICSYCAYATVCRKDYVGDE